MDRQRIIETNRSLRNIKNELESLLEKGVLSDEAFDSISALLPAESSVSSATSAPSLPVRKKTAELVNHDEPHDLKPAPPAYSQTGPPALPSRNQPPPPAPSKPVLATARALYKYEGSDSRDVSFDKDDMIAIHEYMNADWWMGRNLRTGDEGIFPKNYVLVEQEKEDVRMGPSSAGGPSAPMNPYNSSVPPMAIANGGGERDGLGKVNDNGKKFGKKLGNAAIFGAGATIGGKIVNGIF